MIQPESSSLGMGSMLMMLGGVALLIGFWVVANRFGLLSIEAYEEAEPTSKEVVATGGAGATVPAPLADIYEQLKPLTLDLARQEQELEKLALDNARKDQSLATLKEQLAGQTAKVSELTRELERRHETIKRLSEERRQMAEQLEALHTLLGVPKEDSLLEKVAEQERELAAALGAKEKFSQEVQRLGEHSLFKEVQAEELREFWLTVKLDGKPFMSKRRQDRLLGRMRAEKMVIVRK